jgi:hypothetical protein
VAVLVVMIVLVTMLLFVIMLMFMFVFFAHGFIPSNQNSICLHPLHCK